MKGYILCQCCRHVDGARPRILVWRASEIGNKVKLNGAYIILIQICNIGWLLYKGSKNRSYSCQLFTKSLPVALMAGLSRLTPHFLPALFEMTEIGQFKLGDGEGYAEMIRYHAQSQSLLVTSSADRNNSSVCQFPHQPT